jgi:hypothetical protein
MNNIVLLILLIVILVFFIGLTIFINNYCLYTLCTAPEEYPSAEKLLAIKGIKALRDDHITDI